MKVLIVGNGGREHALVWKINKSPLVKKIYCAPGNGGTQQLAENIPINGDNIPRLIEFALKEKIDLTVVGPELPLTLGITDEFTKVGCKIFGVQKNAAILEGSKAFTKKFLKKNNIPTADYEIFDNPYDAKLYIKKAKTDLVVKADGLAQGKGVTVCRTKQEAVDAVDTIMVNRIFGAAGTRIVIEERLEGEEASFLAVTDGTHIIPLATSQDHKALNDGNTGPNTGGMGAYSPAPLITEALHIEIMETIMIPTVSNMAKEGRPISGVLYAGLMIKKGVPKVLEYNCRFGDPEIQPILMRMESDIMPLFLSAIDKTLNEQTISWSKKSATTVIMASKGYPEKYKLGIEISGLENSTDNDSSLVFHGGTTQTNEKVVTNGGRVLGVGALGNSLEESIKNAYAGVSKISFDGAYFRTDIGKKGVNG